MTESELEIAINKLLSGISLNIAISSFVEVPTLVLPDTPAAKALLEEIKQQDIK